MNRYRITYKDLRQSEPSTLMVYIGAVSALVVLYPLIIALFIL